MDLVGDIARHYLHIPIVMGSVVLYAFLLYYGFFKPVIKVLDERRGRQESGASLALKAREESDRQLALYESKVSEARKAGMKAREEVRREITEYQNRLLEEVKNEIAGKKSAREKEFMAFVESAEKELMARIPELAVTIAEKVLKRRVAA